jgi:hypothetical protein
MRISTENREQTLSAAREYARRHHTSYLLIGHEPDWLHPVMAVGHAGPYVRVKVCAYP